jgi:hypothetical protein
MTVRPDLGFGEPVVLSESSLSNYVLYRKARIGGSQFAAARAGVVWTPVPPQESGAVWQFCKDINDRFSSCEGVPRDACLPSPLLERSKTAAIVGCPCCTKKPNKALDGAETCHCDLGDHDTSEAVVLDQIAIADRRGIDVYSSVYDRLGAMFLRSPQRLRGGFQPERLLGSRLSDAGTIEMRKVAWIQWGVLQTSEGPKEWQT